MRIPFGKKPVTSNHIISGSSLVNFFRIMADNRFRVHPRYFLRFIQSLLIILLTIPFFLLEKLIFNNRIRKTEVKSPVFILGYPRSGTTHMVYLLSKDPTFAFCKTYEVIGPHVIFTFGKILRAIALRSIPKVRPMDNMALGADLPKEEEFAIGNMGIESMSNAIYFPSRFSEYFDRFVLFKKSEKERQNWCRNHLFFTKKIVLKNKGKRMLMKSPFDTGRVPELLKLYPDAKFIHIYRNPISVYYSNEKLYEGILPEAAFQEVADNVMTDHIFYTYKATYTSYFQKKDLIPAGNLYEVSYEDFIGNELRHLEAIYTKLQLGDFTKIKSLLSTELHSNKSYRTNVHKGDPNTDERIKADWGEIGKQLGYTE